MTSKERYYNNLVCVLSKLETLCDWNKYLSMDSFRRQFTEEEKESFRLLIQQARLGLNKEKIDALDDYIDYDKILIREWQPYGGKIPNGQTLPWMKVVKGDLKKYHLKTCIKDIRNALLHTNYVPEYSDTGKINSIFIEYPKYKNQSYHATLQEPQFSHFMQELYGNSNGMTFGHTYFSIDDKNVITSENELDCFLGNLEVITTEIKGGPTSNHSIYQRKKENLFESLSSLRCILDGQKFTAIIEDLTKLEPNFTWHSMQITPIHREWIKQYLVKHYPEFYRYDINRKRMIIMGIVELLVNPYQSISGTFEYFEALLDEKPLKLNSTYEQYMISLQLLKMYTLSYRIQNHMCERNEICHYQMDQFYDRHNREENKCNNFEKLRVMRNALAHGNIVIYIASSGDDIGLCFQDHYAPVEESILMFILHTKI